MDVEKLESVIYNYSIHVIGFNMTLKKANQNNAVTSEIVNKAGALNTCIMDAGDLKGHALNLQIGQCIKITDAIQHLLNRLDFQGEFDDEKTNLQIETAEVLNQLEKFVKKDS